MGIPKIVSITVNGEDETYSSYIEICQDLSSHSIVIEYQGDADNCTVWDENSTKEEFDTFCDEIDFTLVYNSHGSPPYEWAYIDATLTNPCGNNSRTLILCPTYTCGYSIEMDLFPNPAQNVTSVSISNLEKTISGKQLNNTKVEIFLYDIFGNLMLAETYDSYTGIIDINTEKFHSGIYTIEARVGLLFTRSRLIVAH